jgi:hypothetical protein
VHVVLYVRRHPELNALSKTGAVMLLVCPHQRRRWKLHSVEIDLISVEYGSAAPHDAPPAFPCQWSTTKLDITRPTV